MRAIFCALIICLNLPFVATAGSRISYRGIDGGASQTVLVGAGKLRIDADSENRIIIDPASGTMLVVHLADRNYTRIDRPNVRKLVGQLNDTLEQVEGVLSNVPEEFRSGVNEMIGNAGGRAGMKPVSLSNTGRRDSAAGHNCIVWRSESGGESVGEACVGDISAWELDAADLATAQASITLLGDWSRELQRGAVSRYFKAITFPSNQVPLRVTQIDGGQRSSSEFSGSDRIGVEPGDFAIPAGFREKPLEVPALGG
ncbi:MAG: hypothetical protein ABIR16_04460 [Dokdonella sp.]